MFLNEIFQIPVTSLTDILRYGGLIASFFFNVALKAIENFAKIDQRVTIPNKVTQIIAYADHVFVIHKY